MKKVGDWKHLLIRILKQEQELFKFRADFRVFNNTSQSRFKSQRWEVNSSGDQTHSLRKDSVARVPPQAPGLLRLALTAVGQAALSRLRVEDLSSPM